MNYRLYLLFFCALCGFCLSCQEKSEQQTVGFQLIPAEASHLHFANTIEENDTFNVLEFDYIYHGAGVGVADFDKDGLQDVFFAGNMVASKLYLNKGELTFEPLSDDQLPNKNRWCTGVSIVDINADGWLDIYVSVAGRADIGDTRNLLYINQGTTDEQPLTFQEMAVEYGLADAQYTIQAAFFDYDNDGDLDAYLLNNHSEMGYDNTIRKRKSDGSYPNTDKLYENKGVKNGHPVFEDVSAEKGILWEGYGLGIALGDINKDGWTDIYVANDFLSNDLLYINHEGTFMNEIRDYIDHQSWSAMGTDLADFNNDSLLDLITLEMLPPEHARRKMIEAPVSYDVERYRKNYGYEPQYVRNTVQLNNGEINGQTNFSEIGQLLGVDATDWSWSALWMDADNDGDKDLHITNGFPKDIIDNDFITSRRISVNGTFSMEERRQLLRPVLNELHPIDRSNYVYENSGDLQLTDQTKSWGMERPSFSYGAAYGDLDNDGDLDLVVNNINEKAFLYENKTTANHLRIQLNGTAANTNGIGAKVAISTNGHLQYAEFFPCRGYQSSVEPFLHFGLAQDTLVDWLEVTWTDGTKQRLEQIEANQLLVLDQNNSTIPNASKKQLHQPFLKEVSTTFLPNYTHQENDYIDFKSERLLQRKYSTSGPAVAVGDVSQDGLEDFILGGTRAQATQLFIQQKNGTFQHRPLCQDLIEAGYEDAALLLFDADSDGDLDVYVGSGGNESTTENQDYIYFNDGQGNFQRADNALPKMTASSARVVANDFDRDGDLDLFVGGRLLANQYPKIPNSYLLRNDSGRFTDVTPQLAPELQQVGLVTTALWTDFNNDDLPDLVLAGEWMNIQFFENKKDHFERLSNKKLGLPHLSGWWNSATAGDIDNDGDTDYVFGNYGLNSKFKASTEQPIHLFADDFDKNGSIDPVMAHYLEGQLHFVHSRDEMIDQLLMLRRKFQTYESYAYAQLKDVLADSLLEKSMQREVVELRSGYLENVSGENGKDVAFRWHPLPLCAQFAPVFGLELSDVNQDGQLDLMMMGNLYENATKSGQIDAQKGTVLLGTPMNGFEAIPMAQHGFYVPGTAKALARIRHQNQQPTYLATRNGDRPKLFMNCTEQPREVVAALPMETHALIQLTDGRIRKQELYYGEGDLSQSSRMVLKNEQIDKITFFQGATVSRIIQLEELQ